MAHSHVADTKADGADETDIPNPLFALAQANLPEAELTALYRVLMRCGCSIAAVLNARDRHGMTPLMRAVKADNTTAVELLLKTRHVDVGAGCESMCCAVCALLSRDSSWAFYATAAVKRLPLSHLLACLLPPHSTFRSAMRYGPAALHVLGCVEAAWRASERQTFDTLTAAVGGNARRSALCEAAGASDGVAWTWLTTGATDSTALSPATGAVLLEHANSPSQFSRAFESPLHAALTLESAAEADRRGSWLVTRLCSEQLNKYNADGKTPLHIAAERGLPLTLHALLQRAAAGDVDLTLPPGREGARFVEVDTALSAARFDTGTTVWDLLDAHIRSGDGVLSCRALRTDLKELTKWQRDKLLPRIADAARSALECDALKKPEIVDLCFAYAALPLPPPNSGDGKTAAEASAATPPPNHAGGVCDPAVAKALTQRLQLLLLPQRVGGDSEQWTRECQKVYADVAAYDRDPSNPPLNASRWLDDARLLWPKPKEETKTNANGTGVDVMDWPNPLFALAHTNRLSRDLFHVLMRCGCRAPEVLNARDRNGMTPLMRAVKAGNITAVSLLLGVPNVDVSSGCATMCCAVCALFRAAVNGRVQDRSETRAVRMEQANDALARLTESQLRARLSGRHTLLLDAMMDGESALRVIECIDTAWRAAAAGTAERQELQDVLIGQSYTLLRHAIRHAGDTAWRALTDPACAFGVALLAHANSAAQFSREFESPLHAALTLASSDSAEADRRGSWLVPRLCSEQLNKYDAKGQTPLHIAAARGLPLTLNALLRRAKVDDVDLTLPPGCDELAFPDADAPLHGAQFDTQKTAVDLLCDDDDDLSEQLEVLAKELDAQTKRQRDELPRVAAVARPVLQDAKVGKMPREIVAFCFAYAALPVAAAAQPVAAVAALPPPRRPAARAAADAADAPPAKRQRTK